MRRAANYERPKINVHHHHHVHFMRNFMACIPLSYAIHIVGFLDGAFAFLSFVIATASMAKASQQMLQEAVSPTGIKLSYVYRSIQFGFFATFGLVYVPRLCLYLFFLFRGRKIKTLHLYMTLKSVSFFIMCLLALGTLITTFVFSTKLTSTFGTSVAYMLALFMIPVDILVAIDLYLCNTARLCLEERIWQAQPKIQHKRHADDEEPVKTEIIETNESKNAY